MGGVTKRAKIAADHRDAVADVEAVADRPSNGVRRARGKRRPWVVEYAGAPHGEWTQWGPSYETQRAAEAAKRSAQHWQASRIYDSQAIWRVRNTEKGAEDGSEIRPRMVDGEPVCDRGCDIYKDGGR